MGSSRKRLLERRSSSRREIRRPGAPDPVAAPRTAASPLKWVSEDRRSQRRTPGSPRNRGPGVPAKSRARGPREIAVTGCGFRGVGWWGADFAGWGDGVHGRRRSVALLDRRPGYWRQGQRQIACDTPAVRVKTNVKAGWASVCSHGGVGEARQRPFAGRRSSAWS